MRFREAHGRYPTGVEAGPAAAWPHRPFDIAGAARRRGADREYTNAERKTAGAAAGPDAGIRAGTAADECVLAGVQLPVGRNDLPAGQPAAEAAAAARARQASAARALGHEPRAVVRVGAPEPPDSQGRSRRHLRGRAGPRGAWRPRTRVPRRHLLRDLSGQEPGRGGHAQVLQAVLLPRAHRQPRNTGDAGLYSRRRRARVQPFARVWDGVRQPGCDRRVRRWRRRGGNGSARDGVAFQQVREPDPRRRGPADPEPERLQDRQPEPALAHQPRRARGAVRRLRLYAVLRRGQRPGGDAPEDGGDAGGSGRRHPRGSESRARIQDAVPAALADDRAPVAERVDRPCGDQRSQGGRLVAIASGPVLRRA